jgi:hypothetical protein
VHEVAHKEVVFAALKKHQIANQLVCGKPGVLDPSYDSVQSAPVVEFHWNSAFACHFVGKLRKQCFIDL